MPRSKTAAGPSTPDKDKKSASKAPRKPSVPVDLTGVGSIVSADDGKPRAHITEVKPRTKAPEVKPQTKAPEVKAQTTKPAEVKPQATKVPEVKPRTTKPPEMPQTTRALEVKPTMATETRALPTSSEVEATPPSMEVESVVPPATDKPALSPASNKPVDAWTRVLKLEEYLEALSRGSTKEKLKEVLDASPVNVESGGSAGHKLDAPPAQVKAGSQPTEATVTNASQHGSSPTPSKVMAMIPTAAATKPSLPPAQPAKVPGAAHVHMIHLKTQRESLLEGIHDAVEWEGTVENELVEVIGRKQELEAEKRELETELADLDSRKRKACRELTTAMAKKTRNQKALTATEKDLEKARAEARKAREAAEEEDDCDMTDEQDSEWE